MSTKRRDARKTRHSTKSRCALFGEDSKRNGANTAGVRVEQLEAVLLSSRGTAIRAALRKGPILVVTLRLAADAWEPLYALVGPWRVELPPEFDWPLEAIATLEAAALTR
jgi:hypothetical protein